MKFKKGDIVKCISSRIQIEYPHNPNAPKCNHYYVVAYDSDEFGYLYLENTPPTDSPKDGWSPNDFKKANHYNTKLGKILYK
jgi:hypothetical protein